VAPEPLEAFWARVAAELPAALRPELLVDRAGGFPSARRARVLWLGASERPGTEGRLARLHAGVRRAAGATPELAASLQREAPVLQAHVTVARPRGAPGDPGARFLALAPRVAWTPERLALVESVRGSGPSLYRPLAELALG
jgi:2'-5' RNA ligase